MTEAVARPAVPAGAAPVGAFAVPPRVLLHAPAHDLIDTLGRTLRAVGCRVESCEVESALWERLQTARWDVLLHEPGPGTAAGDDFPERLRGAFPDVRLWLLLTPEDARAAASLAARDRRVRIFRKAVSADELLAALREETAEEEGGAEEARVLLVDTDPVFCEAVLDFLNIEGHRARTARSGVEALEEVRREFYHAVLVDARLPDAAAWDLAAQMRAARPHLVVIVLADYASHDMVLRAMRADVYDCLLKPLDPFAFRRTLRKALEKQRMGLQIDALLEGLKRANGDLVRVNDLKSQFLRVVSHDLRTPLTAVKGYAQALKAGLIPAEKFPKAFATMVRECEHLEHLIGDLVDFVSIEAGKMRLDLSPVEPRAVFEPVVERFRDAMERDKVAYRAEGLGAPLPLVMGDARRLDQVLTNLVGNALKHSSSGGSVTVRFADVGGALEVRVADAGEGILPDHLARVFDQFFQVESSPARGQGLGLGLAIAREIVHRHGGRIGAASEGLGKGATFWFTIPALTSAKL